MLPFVEGRPITLIRYPDGVLANRFYSKNRPSWTPDWVGATQVDKDDDNVYSIVNDLATLAYMANLATLEFHPMTIKAAHPTKPDHFILDLDPSDDIDFATIKDLAADLKMFLEGFGYYPFLKTSGGKGLHLYVPIQPLYEQQEVVAAVKAIAKEYVQENSATTLRMSKETRKGKILLDIYRNNKSQTCAAPYSTRGKVGCPISTPLYWEELASLTSSAQYNMFSIMEKLNSDGDPWMGYYEHAQPLHTNTQVVQSDKLELYQKKRNFGVTKEPAAEMVQDYVGQSRYVLQIHDASNLHYDLRLESDGVLLSWAIPKGLPVDKGVKRLAIQTEPHPIKYLTFEGIIPKTEYGGGQMWIFDSGQYQILEREPKKISFRLNGNMAGTYRMINTKDKQWLVERRDKEVIKASPDFGPMLASTSVDIPSSNNYLFEIKWDGIRVLIKKVGKEVYIYSRAGNDITAKFPRVAASCQEIEAEHIITDGEIVALDSDGLPNFGKTVGRMHLKGKAAIETAAKRTTTAVYLFDCLSLDGNDIRQEPIEKRRAWLRANYKSTHHLRYSDSFDDGDALFKAVVAKGMEGIMCKGRGSKYDSDTRSKSWLKIKVRSTDTAYVIGFTEGKGDRSGLFGSMHLAKKEPSGWKYKGKVGTGFTHDQLRDIFSQLQKVAIGPKLISETVDEEVKTTWVVPSLIAEVQYASITANDTYREPVFLGVSSVK